MVTDNTGRTLFELNADEGRIPASLTKIVTAAASLYFFDSGHKFVTALYRGDDVKEGVLQGPLYLKGGGDPSFVSEDFWELINEFKRTGVKTIRGPIIVDETRFDDQRFDKSRDPERVDRAYDAPIGPMSFNWNAVNVFVRPGSKVGDPAQIFLDPENDFTILNSAARTGSHSSQNTIQVLRTEIKEKGQIKNRITIRGVLPITSKEMVKYTSITQPGLWSGYNLMSFLRQRGIQVDFEGPQVQLGKMPANVVLMADVESKDVSSIVVDMQKYSNNYVAEMLVKNLAAEFVSQPASLNDGFQYALKFLDLVGIPRSRFHLQSPSGLSRKNRMTVRDLASTLNFSQKAFRMGPEFMVALPIANVDGTLKRRFNGTDALGRVRAKTGLLDQVVGLAGYAGRADGGRYTFAYIYNGKKDGATVRNLFDALATELVK
jgi:D-alanyl-D-alanine carboxypeptidase/D-alanyl-D-alanine-endopeptidase (penicillin-binding protein 4)